MGRQSPVEDDQGVTLTEESFEVNGRGLELGGAGHDAPDREQPVTMGAHLRGYKISGSEPGHDSLGHEFGLGEPGSIAGNDLGPDLGRALKRLARDNPSHLAPGWLAPGQESGRKVAGRSRGDSAPEPCKEGGFCEGVGLERGLERLEPGDHFRDEVWIAMFLQGDQATETEHLSLNLLELHEPKHRPTRGPAGPAPPRRPPLE